MKQTFILQLVLVIGYLELSRGQEGPCIKTGPCSCRYADGSVIDLESLSSLDGLPFFTNVSDGNGGFVSWNPCTSFTIDGTECQDVAVCAMRDGIPYTLYYDLGRQDSARFTINVNGSLLLTYSSDQGDFKRSAIITLQCLEASAFDFFVNEGEQEPDNDTIIFEMVLASKHACPKYQRETTEVPVTYTYTETIEPITAPYMTTPSVGCTQISTCSCMFPDGTIINLQQLTSYDGIPKFANISDGRGNAVSWNPCQSFTYAGTDCYDTAVCVIRDGIPFKTFYNLGSEYSARFGRDLNGNLIISYTSNEGAFSRVASIKLDCDYWSSYDNLQLEGESMPNQYTIQFDMVLTSPHACPYMPTTVNPPIMTTEASTGCYQGSDVCKCSYLNGTAIDLEPVSKFDDTPYFYNVESKEGDKVSWNPCKKFTFKGTSCVDSFICIAIEEEFTIGFYGLSEPQFSVNENGIETIVYENENIHDKNVKITIALECLRGSETNFLLAERVPNPFGSDLTYRMVLASRYACLDNY